MAAYATYAQYNALYPGMLTETEFGKRIGLAGAVIDVVTHNRAATETAAYKVERLTYCACALINEIRAQDAVKGEGGARVASVSNDGYTETYGGGATGANGPDAETQALRSVARFWLSGTGLVSAL